MPLNLPAEAPVAEKRPVDDTRHGITRTDEYGWLRAANWQEVMRDPGALPADIRAYLEAENAYQEAALEPFAELRETLFEELKGRIKQDDSSVPTPDGPYLYQSRYEEGAEYPLVVRRPRNEGSDEEVLLDGPKQAEGTEYFALGLIDHSPDHKRIAWSVDTKGSEYDELRIRDAATGVDADDVVPDVGSFAWASDSESFVFVRVDESHRPRQAFCKRPGEPERLIYDEADPRYYVGVSRSLDGTTIELGTGMNDADEVRLLPADDPTSEPLLMAKRRDGHEYSVEVAGDEVFVVTNRDDAVNYKIMVAPRAEPAESNWRELVPHRDDVMIKSLLAFENWLVRLERENALPRIVVRDRRTGEEHALLFEEEAYALGLSAGYEYATDTLRFTYSSPATPSQVWDYDMAERTRTLRKTQEIPSGHDPADYVVRRLHAPADDGELVPLTVLYHRNTAIDGTAPCLLYGYGSYGAGMPAGFQTNRLSLVDRGFVHVTAHIRGGDEKGRHWYEQTKKAGKHKTFDDFIAAGRHLAVEGYTYEGGIVAQGGSAGGLLMGAVANMAPSLFAGIIAQVPFVDVLNTMLDDTLPLTPGEWSQWGNPIESAEEYEIIASYSPYDNVTEQPYPKMLVLAGLTDPRVTYWEPAKWVARLRDRSPEAPILFKTNMGTGHFGKTGRFAYLDEVTLVYAFALAAVGKA